MAKIIPSVKRAFEILELFLDGTKSFSVPEISLRLGLPRTTTYELVQTLLDCGYFERAVNQPQRFKLGLRVFELGNIYAAQLDITHEGQKAAQKVSKACDETVQMAIHDGTDACVHHQSRQLPDLEAGIGSRFQIAGPLHCSR